MTGQLRVLFLSSCVRGGGAGFSLYYLIKHLDRRAFEPVVVVPHPGIFAELYAALGVSLVTAPALPERTAQQRYLRNTPATRLLSSAQNLWGAAATVPWLADLARSQRIDLLYCNNMAVKPVGALAAQLAGLPCVLHARNVHESPGAKALYCQSVARLPAVRCVIANSEASARPYRAAVAHKVSVVSNGVDLGEYRRDQVARGMLRSRFSIGADEFVVGYTGNLVEHKGLLTLIRAVGALHLRGHRIHVAIVGRVPVGACNDFVPRCQAEIERLGLQRHAHFVGFMPDARPAMADFDVLAVPSFKESFGRVIIEAFALDTPVVASAVGGVPELVEDARTGLLVPAGDADALVGSPGTELEFAL